MEFHSEEAVSLVWEGAIPLQIHLHESDVTTLPPPPPVLILGPRIGYLLLLIPIIKTHFNDSLPPGADTVWFDYKGLPLKWYLPIGVLFDLLCAEPERPWNLTVHFRGYPGEILTPCNGEDPVKWSFINSLKEASYIINGNCKNVMNMSQTDQSELWQSLAKGNMEGYTRISSKLKLEPFGDDSYVRMSTGRIPIRLYLRNLEEDAEDLDDMITIDNWDSISFINRPVDINHEVGHCITLKRALRSILPEYFDNEDHEFSSGNETKEINHHKIKLIRVQGIELDLNIPFLWVASNLKNPEFFLHICMYIVS